MEGKRTGRGCAAEYFPLNVQYALTYKELALEGRG